MAADVRYVRLLLLLNMVCLMPLVGSLERCGFVPYRRGTYPVTDPALLSFGIAHPACWVPLLVLLDSLVLFFS